jgi:hypothetical protein
VAREFGRLKTVMWQRPKFHALSDDGKMLWLYLISCPHGNALGAFVASRGYMGDDLRWQPERLIQTVSELLAKGFIDRDDTFDLIIIRGWWEHNTIENPKVAIGAMKTFETLPQCEKLWAHFRDFSALPEPLRKLFAERYPNGIETKKPKPEPEPEIQPEPQSAPSAAPVVKRETSNTRTKGTRLAVDAEPDEQDIRYAGDEYGWPAERIAREWSNLRDWSQSSKNGAKLDWRATWRTWVRRCEAEQPTKPTRTRERRAGILAALGGELANNADGSGRVGGTAEPDGDAAGEPCGVVADLGIDGHSGISESLRGSDGQVVRLGGNDGPGSGRGSGNGGLPRDVGGRASRSAGHGNRTNDSDAPLPQSPEASGHPQTDRGGLSTAAINADDSAGEPESDPLDIPPFLRRSA